MELLIMALLIPVALLPFYLERRRRMTTEFFNPTTGRTYRA